MTPMRIRMIEDMRLAGLADRTQEAYVQAVAGLAKHYRRSPEHLSEEEVRRHLLELREQGPARGSFKISITGYSFYTATRSARTGRFFRKKMRLPKQKRLPQALSDVEVRHILANVRNPIHRACLG